MGTQLSVSTVFPGASDDDNIVSLLSLHQHPQSHHLSDRQFHRSGTIHVSCPGMVHVSPGALVNTVRVYLTLTGIVQQEKLVKYN